MLLYKNYAPVICFLQHQLGAPVIYSYLYNRIPQVSSLSDTSVKIGSQVYIQLFV